MSLTILSPRPQGTAFSDPHLLDKQEALKGSTKSTALAGLAGKKVGFRVEWPSFHVFMEEFETILRDEYEVDDITWWSLSRDNPHADGGRSNLIRIGALLDRLTDSRDVVISGLGN